MMDIHIDCICTHRPHKEGDTITLRDTLSFREATAVRKNLAYVDSDDLEARGLENLAALTEGYLLFGIESWTLVNAEGKPIPIGHRAIRENLLDNPHAYAEVMEVADAADNLYSKAVLIPLLARASTSSRPKRTADSTSAKSGSTQTARKPSRRSSTTTTRTADTGTIFQSPGGGSNS